MNTDKLNPKTIDALRDLALSLEFKEMDVAMELMSIAHIARPNGFFIRDKVKEYYATFPARKELRKLVNSGVVAIIPIGFRCYTRRGVREQLGIAQASLPFDNGFFPPSSIVSVLKNPNINLHYPDSGSSHHVCIKNECYDDPEKGRGIRFEKSSYDEINTLANSPTHDDLNKYLDSTFAYYTRDTVHNFVLAHYNWHKFAKFSKPDVSFDPQVNLKEISDTLNKRIERMFAMCNKAEHVFFMYCDVQNFQFMLTDDLYQDMTDLSEVEEVVKNTFSANTYITSLKEMNSADKILDAISHDYEGAKASNRDEMDPGMKNNNPHDFELPQELVQFITKEKRPKYRLLIDWFSRFFSNKRAHN